MKVAQRVCLALAASLIFALAGCDDHKKVNGPPVVQPPPPNPDDPASDAKAPPRVVLKAPN
jgi:hypothetical protein